MHTCEGVSTLFSTPASRHEAVLSAITAIGGDLSKSEYPLSHVDDVMGDRGDYHIAFLTAAMLHGAAHHYSRFVQIIAAKPVPASWRQRQWIYRFTQRSGMDVRRPYLAMSQVEDGWAWTSCPELTALDLASDVSFAAGADNAATVMADLGDWLAPEKLAEVSGTFPSAAGQRLGVLMDAVGFGAEAEPMRRSLAKRGLRWAELDGRLARPNEFSAAPAQPVEMNEKWRVVMREHLDPDWTRM